MANVTGQAEVMRNLVELARAFPQEAATALQAELEIEATESQRRTPVETGALRASHAVTVDGDGEDVVGRITVGGAAAPYAVYVHENLEAYHPVGQAKFLESTLTESARFLPSRLAKRIRLAGMVR